MAEKNSSLGRSTVQAVGPLRLISKDSIWSHVDFNQLQHFASAQFGRTEVLMIKNKYQYRTLICGEKMLVKTHGCISFLYFFFRTCTYVFKALFFSSYPMAVFFEHCFHFKLYFYFQEVDERHGGISVQHVHVNVPLLLRDSHHAPIVLCFLHITCTWPWILHLNIVVISDQVTDELVSNCLKKQLQLSDSYLFNIFVAIKFSADYSTKAKITSFYANNIMYK